MQKQILRLAVLFTVCVISVCVAGSELFPRPESLQPAIAFWTRVYTEVDSNAGYIHDNRNLEIVYETLHFRPGSSRLEQNRVIERALRRYRQTLLDLAQGVGQDPGKEAQQVLRSWGDQVSSQTLEAAAGRLRFQRGQADNFRGGLIRSGAWEASIRDTLQALDLPAGLAVLPHVESSYNPRVQSRAGAAGLWQFTRNTGRRYLRVDYVVDERLDPLVATKAAARHLQHNYSVLGSWPLAITAYNHGLSGMRRAVRTTGTRDIGLIVQEYNGSYFGFASRNFYAAFLAAGDVAGDYERYFGVLVRHCPDTDQSVELPAYLPVSALVRQLDLDAATLQRLNPPLQPAVWRAEKYLPRGYRLRLPPGIDVEETKTRLQQLALVEGRTVQLPDLSYTVQPGDTLSEIAQHYKTSVRDLMAMNDVPSRHRIRAGQKLRLPGAASTGKDRQAGATADAGVETPPLATTVDVTGTRMTAEAGGTLALEAGADELPGNTASGDNMLQLSADPADYEVAVDQTIEVQAAETLGHYAEWLEIHASRLRHINGLRSGQSLHTGSRLKLDFSTVPVAIFEQRRLDYHQQNQSMYFKRHRISGACMHDIRAGDSLWVLASRDYGIPLWLLRQYNPDIDFGKVLPEGASIMIPLVEELVDETLPVAGAGSVNVGSCTLPATGSATS
ncbi:MAG: transglycosylase SLT domain-containing protein [Gammaproteobacteria bacterium]|jgi:membrane-bound lytic murein transglycosylase D